MNYRRLGRAGLKVSEIAFGNWITAGGKNSIEDSMACHRKAFDLGINCFDTADCYAGGQAEEVLGRVLQDLSRKDLVLATKCCVPMGKGPNDGGLSRKHVREACEASLRRLKTEYIDLYQAHDFDAATPSEEICRAFDDLIRQGKIVYWGLSNWDSAQTRDAVAICDARGFDRPVGSQPRYSLFYREIEKDLLSVCAQWGIGFIVYSPLCQGLLSGKYAGGKVPPNSRAGQSENYRRRFLTPYNETAVEGLSALAKESALSLSQLALAWILRRPEMSAAIVGASRPEQLEDNAKASGVKLDEELLARIQVILDRRWATILEEDAAKLRKEAK